MSIENNEEVLATGMVTRLNKLVEPQDKISVNLNISVVKSILENEKSRSLEGLTPEEQQRNKRLINLFSGQENKHNYGINYEDLKYLGDFFEKAGNKTRNELWNKDKLDADTYKDKSRYFEDIKSAMFNVSSDIDNIRILNNKFNAQEQAEALSMLTMKLEKKVEPKDKVWLSLSPTAVEALLEHEKNNYDNTDRKYRIEDALLHKGKDGYGHGAYKINYEDLKYIGEVFEKLHDEVLFKKDNNSLDNDKKRTAFNGAAFNARTAIQNIAILTERLNEEEYALAKSNFTMKFDNKTIEPKHENLAYDAGTDIEKPVKKKIIDDVVFETPKTEEIQVEKKETVFFNVQTPVLKELVNHLEKARHEKSTTIYDYGRKESDMKEEVKKALKSGSNNIQINVEGLQKLKDIVSKVIEDNEWFNKRKDIVLPDTHKGMKKLFIECGEKLEWAMNVAESLKDRINLTKDPELKNKELDKELNNNPRLKM